MALVALAGCRGDDGNGGEGAESTAQAKSGSGAEEANETERPFGGPADVDRAEALWTQIEGYRDWAPWPGHAGFQPGQGPHGRFLKVYVNDVVMEDPAAVGHGSIVVKENYTAEQDDALGPITVMQRIEDYAPDHADWFWVKYDSSGEVMENDDGVPLAGRVAKGMPAGCIACHSDARGGDYVFTNDS